MFFRGPQFIDLIGLEEGPSQVRDRASPIDGIPT